jgi:hypothetical protein
MSDASEPESGGGRSAGCSKVAKSGEPAAIIRTGRDGWVLYMHFLAQPGICMLTIRHPYGM